jgi:hypothetical protein
MFFQRAPFNICTSEHFYHIRPRTYSFLTFVPMLASWFCGGLLRALKAIGPAKLSRKMLEI